MIFTYPFVSEATFETSSKRSIADQRPHALAVAGVIGAVAFSRRRGRNTVLITTVDKQVPGTLRGERGVAW